LTQIVPVGTICGDNGGRVRSCQRLRHSRGCALYRSWEVVLIAESTEAAALFEERLFEPEIARARRAEPPAGARERLRCRVADRLTFFL
jgi:hypothetical protein